MTLFWMLCLLLGLRSSLWGSLNEEKPDLAAIRQRITDLQKMAALSGTEREELSKLKQHVWASQTSEAHQAKAVLAELAQKRHLTKNETRIKAEAEQTLDLYKRQKAAKKAKEDIKLQTSQATVEALKPVQAQGQLTPQQKQALKDAEQASAKIVAKKVAQKQKKIDAGKDVEKQKQEIETLKQSVSKVATNVTAGLKKKAANGTITKAEKKFLIREEAQSHQRDKAELEALKKAGKTSQPRFMVLKKKIDKKEKDDKVKQKELAGKQKKLQAEMKKLQADPRKKQEMKTVRKQLKEVLTEAKTRAKAKEEEVIAKEKSGGKLTKQEVKIKKEAEKARASLQAIRKEDDLKQDKKLFDAKAKLDVFKQQQKKGVVTEEQSKAAAQAMAVVEKIERKKVEKQKRKVEEKRATAKTPEDQVKVAKEEAKLAQMKAEKKESKKERSQIIADAKSLIQSSKQGAASAQILLEEDQKQTVKQTHRQVSKMKLIPVTQEDKKGKKSERKVTPELKQAHKEAKKIITEIGAAKKTGIPLTKEEKAQLRDAKLSEARYQGEKAADLAKQISVMKSKEKPTMADQTKISRLQTQVDAILTDLETKSKQDKEKQKRAESIINATQAKGDAATPEDKKVAEKAEKQLRRIAERRVTTKEARLKVLKEAAKAPDTSPALQERLKKMKHKVKKARKQKDLFQGTKEEPVVGVPRKVADALSVAEQLARKAEGSIDKAMKDEKDVPKDVIFAFQAARSALEQIRRAHGAILDSKKDFASLHKKTISSQTTKSSQTEVLEEIKRKQEEILDELDKQQARLQEILTMDLPAKIKKAVRGLGFYSTLLHSLRHPYLPDTNSIDDYIQMFD